MIMKVDWEYDPKDPNQTRSRGTGLEPTLKDWLVIGGILAAALIGALISGS